MYLEEFEKKESSFPKKDETIYNCPFLGYIEPEQKKIGCMIHPIKTGDQKSQNFSFYGASICQSYDCKNKERRDAADWESLLNSLELDFYEYSNLAGDSILLTRIEAYFTELGISLEKMFRDNSFLLKKILLHKFKQPSSHITSFEIDMESNLGISTFQHLVGKLGLAVEEELYRELEVLAMDSARKLGSNSSPQAPTR